MALRVWHSFSCNNSSSYRLIGTFRDAKAAEEAAADLRAFIAEASPLAEWVGRSHPTLTEQTSFPATDAMDALAARHGFDWTNMIVEADVDDELEVFAEGETVVLYHPYCLGLGEDLPAYLRARGAEVVGARAGDPGVTAMFRAPLDAERSERLVADLAAYFGQADTSDDNLDWSILPPWSPTRTNWARASEHAFFFDGSRIGMHAPMPPSAIPLLKAWLAKHGARELTLRIGELADAAKFRTIARARCPACRASLEYIDRHEHGIATDQLGCRSCGGMFDLEAFAVT